MAGPESGPSKTREIAGKGLQIGGIVAGILGIIALSAEGVLVGAGMFIGGRWVEGGKKR